MTFSAGWSPLLGQVTQYGTILLLGQTIGVEDREVGLQLGRAHVREHEALIFERRVRAGAEPVLERALRRLAGRLEDPTVDVEQPAVVAASDPALGHDGAWGGLEFRLLLLAADTAGEDRDFRAPFVAKGEDQHLLVDLFVLGQAARYAAARARHRLIRGLRLEVELRQRAG